MVSLEAETRALDGLYCLAGAAGGAGVASEGFVVVFAAKTGRGSLLFLAGEDGAAGAWAGAGVVMTTVRAVEVVESDRWRAVRIARVRASSAARRVDKVSGETSA